MSQVSDQFIVVIESSLNVQVHRIVFVIGFRAS